MIKPKKLITTGNLLDKLASVKMALSSNILAIESPAEVTSSKLAIQMAQTGIDIIDEIVPIIEQNGFSPNLDELHKILSCEINKSRVVVLDPNRKREGAPIVYSSFHPDFRLELPRLDKGREAIIIDIKQSKWVKPALLTEKEKEPDEITTKLFLSHLSLIRLALISNSLSIQAAVKDKVFIKNAVHISNTAIKTIDHICEIFNLGGFSPHLDDLFRLINRAILNKQILIRDSGRKRAGDSVIYCVQHPEFSLELSLLDRQRSAVIIKIRRSKGATKAKRAIIPSDDLL